MSTLNKLSRKPTHPGALLREDFLPNYGLTITRLAKCVGVSRQSINELIRERRAVSPEMSLRLAKLFGNSPEFWLNAQRAVDLWTAQAVISSDLESIKSLSLEKYADSPEVNREDLVAFEERRSEPTTTYNELVEDLKANNKL